MNLALACGDEHLGASYVEEIQAKQFKAGNSVALFANGELLAAARRSAANQTALLWTSPAFLDGRGIAAAFEPLPEAA
ncbi:MAG: hypothetical protein HYY23_11745 [Verrucomicrobia bacterium]|nr:hypothetical protein [Verrucomicrobiota bacterium]